MCVMWVGVCVVWVSMRYVGGWVWITGSDVTLISSVEVLSNGVTCTYYC